MTTVSRFLLWLAVSVLNCVLQVEGELPLPDWSVVFLIKKRVSQGTNTGVQSGKIKTRVLYGTPSEDLS